MSEYRNNRKLKGLMLGIIHLLLKDNDTLKEFNNSSKLNNIFFNTKLAQFLQIIINIRNEHAHIKAMSLDKFEELYELLFLQKDGLSNIEKLLEMKRIINKRI